MENAKIDPAIKLKESIDWLIENNYIVVSDNRLFITSRVYRDLNIEVKSEDSSVVKTSLSKSGGKRYTVDDFKKFIIEAKVPAFITLTNGSRYRCNSYSKPAAVEFVRIMNSGIMYEVFLEATKRYYRSGGSPKIISNYILDEVWKTSYDEVLSGAKESSKPASDYRKML